MTRKLFTVEDTFTIRQRGTMLLPGLLPQGDEPIRIGDPLRLIRPDGSEVEVVINGFDFFNRGSRGQLAVLVAVPKSEVPINTEVWSL